MGESKNTKKPKIDRASAVAIAVFVAAAIGCLILFLWWMPTHATDQTDTGADASTAETGQAEDTHDHDHDNDTGSDTESDTTAAEPVIDYSAGVDDNGYFSNIRALDYVTLFDGYDAPIISESAASVDDGLIDSDIVSLTSQFGSDQPVDRAAVLNDYVNIDFTGYMDGEAFPGGTAEDQTFALGMGGYIEGFETQIVGHKAGETFDIAVTFPDDYEDGVDANGDPLVFAGKDATFTITLNSVSEKVLTDENIKDAFGDQYTLKDGSTIENIDDARQYFQEYESEQALYNAIIDWLMVGATFADEMPQELYDIERSAETAYFVDMATAAGYDDIDEYMQLAGYESLDAFLDGEQEYFLSDIQFSLLMQAIAETESVEITDADMEEAYGDNYSTLLDYYGKGYLAQQLLNNKIMDQLYDSTEVR